MKLAIVGRPNVGKSALFNRICKKRISIVDEEEGITRDRLYGRADFFSKPFEVIDTGGMDHISKEHFQKKILIQAQIAIEEADVLVMVVDSKVGITELDQYIANLLLKQKKPVVLAVNKVDDFSNGNKNFEFYSLGIEKIVSISAVHGTNIAELLEAAFDGIEFVESKEEEKLSKIAIIGRANVGKSTLLNALIEKDRSIVSHIAGTTRDAIDEKISYNEKDYVLIDTAGIRRKNKEKHVVEKFSYIRTEEAIDRSDICILVFDASESFTSQEKRIAKFLEEKKKGCIIVFNKWDLVKNFRMEHYLKMVKENFSFLSHCPMLFISAKNKRNIDKVFPTVENVENSLNMKISTPHLNKFIEKTMRNLLPPVIKGKRLKIYYLTQISTHPSRFILFVNYSNLLENSYKRYLINQFRKEFSFNGTFFSFEIKGKEKKQKV